MYARAAAAAGHAGDAAKILEPRLATEPEARAIWVEMAPKLGTTDDAEAWLAKVAPAMTSDAERLTLASGWFEVWRNLIDPAAIRSARDIIKPVADRPDAPHDAIALLAEVAQEQADYDAAVGGFRRLLAAAPTDPDSMNNVAYALLLRGRAGDLDEAAHLAEQAVAASPDSSNLYDTLARVYAKAGKHDLAVKTFSSAITRDGRNIEPMIGLADEYARGGKPEEAARPGNCSPRSKTSSGRSAAVVATPRAASHRPGVGRSGRVRWGKGGRMKANAEC